MKPFESSNRRNDPMKAQRNRNWALLLTLFGFATVMYIVAIVKLSSQ